MTHDTAAAKFFDGFAEGFDTLYDGKRNFLMRAVDRHFRSDMLIRFALTFEVVGSLAGKTVLDIGCGSGPYVLEALNRGARQVTALDPAPNMLALVQQRLSKSNFAERCSLLEGSFPGIGVEAHDFVFVLGVMDYIADARAFLRALRPLVKNSAAVSFPSQHWFRTPFRKFRYRLRRCPVYFYNEADIKTLCSTAGFREIKIRKIAGAGMDYHVCLKP